MWTRSARAGALAALALAVLPASAGAQGLSDLIEGLAGTGTSTTAAPAAPAPAPETGATPGPPPTAQPPPSVSDTPIVQAAKQDRGSTTLPAVLVALAVLGVILAVGALAWAVSRWLAFDPRRVQRWRHAGREASYRASGVWADFADWARLGR
jgi:hypothetical protein